MSAPASAPELAVALHATLGEIAARYRSPVLAASFGVEDMVLIDCIARAHPAIGVFTIDTGRLHRETLTLRVAVEQRYGIAVTVVAPDAVAVDRYVAQYGENGFYDSLAARQTCCRLRKVEPLSRALAGHDAWLTGLRREQADTRRDLPRRERDTAHGIDKWNPLADWSAEDVWHYVRRHGVPYNPLHDRGYPSIGCEPCTRAVKPGESMRAGRWWWEDADKKECGLHVHQ